MRQENGSLILDAFPLESAISSIFWSLATLTIATTFSLFSGFHSSPVPSDLAWQFSPIGLLQGLFGGIPPEYLELKSGSYFTGQFGWTFDYLGVFLKTCLCEAPFYLWCFRRENLLRSLALLLTANILTHPFVFFVFPALFDKYIHAALASEAFAAGAEMIFVGWIIGRSVSGRSGLAAASVILAANLFSWEVGMFL